MVGCKTDKTMYKFFSLYLTLLILCHLSGQEAFFVRPLNRETYIYLLSGTLKRGRWAVSRKCIMIQKDNKHQKENFLLWDKHRKSWVLNIGPGIVPVQIAYQKARFASSWLHWKNNKFKSISNERSKQPKFISNMTLLIHNDFQWHLKENGLIFFPT